MEIQTRRADLSGFVSDALVFLASNLKHYSLAVFGVRLRLDPDYPCVFRFLPRLITDTVFEYRGYGLMALWAALIVLVVPLDLLPPLIALWASRSFQRALYFKSSLHFWRQAYRESPQKSRVQVRYAEELLKDLERQYKAGKSWRDLAPEIERATAIIDVISDGKAETSPRRLQPQQ